MDRPLPFKTFVSTAADGYISTNDSLTGSSKSNASALAPLTWAFDLASIETPTYMEPVHPMSGTVFNPIAPRAFRPNLRGSEYSGYAPSEKFDHFLFYLVCNFLVGLVGAVAVLYLATDAFNRFDFGAVVDRRRFVAPTLAWLASFVLLNDHSFVVESVLLHAPFTEEVFKRHVPFGTLMIYLFELVGKQQFASIHPAQLLTGLVHFGLARMDFTTAVALHSLLNLCALVALEQGWTRFNFTLSARDVGLRRFERGRLLFRNATSHSYGHLRDISATHSPRDPRPAPRYFHPYAVLRRKLPRELAQIAQSYLGEERPHYVGSETLWEFVSELLLNDFGDESWAMAFDELATEVPRWESCRSEFYAALAARDNNSCSGSVRARAWVFWMQHHRETYFRCRQSRYFSDFVAQHGPYRYAERREVTALHPRVVGRHRSTFIPIFGSPEEFRFETQFGRAINRLRREAADEVMRLAAERRAREGSRERGRVRFIVQHYSSIYDRAVRRTPIPSIRVPYANQFDYAFARARIRYAFKHKRIHCGAMHYESAEVALPSIRRRFVAQQMDLVWDSATADVIDPLRYFADLFSMFSDAFGQLSLTREFLGTVRRAMVSSFSGSVSTWMAALIDTVFERLWFLNIFKASFRTVVGLLVDQLKNFFNASLDELGAGTSSFRDSSLHVEVKNYLLYSARGAEVDPIQARIVRGEILLRRLDAKIDSLATPPGERRVWSAARDELEKKLNDYKSQVFGSTAGIPAWSLLLYGGAGIGKSRLLDYLAYAIASTVDPSPTFGRAAPDIKYHTVLQDVTVLTIHDMSRANSKDGMAPVVTQVMQLAGGERTVLEGAQVHEKGASMSALMVGITDNSKDCGFSESVPKKQYGPMCRRLHCCFEVVLLPEFQDKERGVLDRAALARFSEDLTFAHLRFRPYYFRLGPFDPVFDMHPVECVYDLGERLLTYAEAVAYGRASFFRHLVAAYTANESVESFNARCTPYDPTKETRDAIIAITQGISERRAATAGQPVPTPLAVSEVAATVVQEVVPRVESAARAGAAEAVVFGDNLGALAQRASCALVNGAADTALDVVGWTPPRDDTFESASLLLLTWFASLAVVYAAFADAQLERLGRVTARVVRSFPSATATLVRWHLELARWWHSLVDLDQVCTALDGIGDSMAAAAIRLREYMATVYGVRIRGSVAALATWAEAYFAIDPTTFRKWAVRVAVGLAGFGALYAGWRVRRRVAMGCHVDEWYSSSEVEELPAPQPGPSVIPTTTSAVVAATPFDRLQATAQPTDQLSVIAASEVALVLSHGSKSVFNRGFRVSDQLLLVPGHIIAAFAHLPPQDVLTLTITAYSKLGHAISPSTHTVTRGQFVDHLSDVTVLRVSTFHHPGRVWFDWFPTRPDGFERYATADGKVAELVYRRLEVSHKDAGGVPKVVPDAIAVRRTTESIGDCGRILFGLNERGVMFPAGLLVAVSKSGLAAYSPLPGPAIIAWRASELTRWTPSVERSYRPDLEWDMSALGQDCGKPGYFASRMRPLSDKSLYRKFVQWGVPVGVDCIGTLEPHDAVSTEPQVVPNHHLIQEFARRHLKKEYAPPVAFVNPTDAVSYKHSLFEVVKPNKNNQCDPRVLDAVFAEILNHPTRGVKVGVEAFRATGARCVPGPLDVDRMACATSASIAVEGGSIPLHQSLNRSGSAGAFWGGKKGDHLRYDAETHTMAAVGRLREDLLAALAEGPSVKIRTVQYMHKLNEVIAVGKVARALEYHNVYWTVLEMWIMGPIFDFIASNPYRFGIIVGLNPFSMSWKQLGDWISFLRKLLVTAGDHSAFSQNQSVRCFEWFARFMRLCARELGYNWLELLWLEALLIGRQNRVLVYNGDLYARGDGSDTGKYGTTFENSIINFIAAMLIWVAYWCFGKSFPVDVNGKTYEYHSYFDNVRNATHGDDMACGDKYDTPGEATMAGWASMGFKVTDEAKTGILSPKDLSEITFLKRRFVIDPLDPSRMLAPLEKESIYKIGFYRNRSVTALRPDEDGRMVRTAIDQFAVQSQLVENQLREAAVWPDPDFFNEIATYAREVESETKGLITSPWARMTYAEAHNHTASPDFRTWAML